MNEAISKWRIKLLNCESLSETRVKCYLAAFFYYFLSSQRTMFFPHKHQRCLIVQTLISKEDSQTLSSIYSCVCCVMYRLLSQTQQRKMNDEKWVFFLCRSRKLDKSLQNPKRRNS